MFIISSNNKKERIFSKIMDALLEIFRNNVNCNCRMGAAIFGFGSLGIFFRVKFFAQESKNGASTDVKAIIKYLKYLLFIDFVYLF